MKTYFDQCKTEQETKDMYRSLSKILHPDVGGTDEQFKDLGNQYQAKLRSLHGTYNSKNDEKQGKKKYQYDEKIEQELMNMLRAIQGLRLPETVDISLQGTWIWVRGTHKNQYGHYPIDSRHISSLESLGLKYHTMKKECYYRNSQNRCYNKGRVMSSDRINRRYKGSSWSNTGAEQLS